MQFLLTHFHTIPPPNSTWLLPLPAEWAHPCLMLHPMKTSWSWLRGRIWPYWLFPSSKNPLFTGPPWYHALLILPLLLWIHLPSSFRRFLFLPILVFLRVLSLYSHPRESNFLPPPQQPFMCRWLPISVCNLDLSSNFKPCYQLPSGHFHFEI